MEFNFNAIIFGIVALVVLSLAFKMFKFGGFKAAMFGAGIKSTAGEVKGSKGKIINMAVKVHELEGDDPEKAIGLEFVVKSFASYQMTPIVLSKTEASKLAKLIQSVAD